MRLLKVGRDASCDIVLHSDKVSTLHAELTLLNNGDITIEDKGSRNGTFIMNHPIKAGKPVNVRRGDAIRFADVELQWSQVPMPEDNSAYRGIYGIGSHFNNDFQISGSTVSRYHATVKHSRDGKMYIVDHSKNGTTVDGVKLSPNTLHRIKKNSAVVCGGVPVDLSRLPWSNNSWKIFGGIAAAVILLIGGWAFPWPWPSPTPNIYSDSELYEMYNQSVVLLVGQFHYEVEAGNLSPEVLEQAGIPSKFKLYDGNEGKVLITDRNPVYHQLISQATGFFVSPNGHIVTNLHVVKPWLFNGEKEIMESICKRIFAQYVAKLDVENLVIKGEATSLSAYTSQIKVVGKLDGLQLVPQGKYYSAENSTTCRVLSAGDDADIDVALVQSEKGELPSHTRFINVKDSMDVSSAALKVGNHMYTMGFPIFHTLQDLRSEKGIQLFARGGNIIQSETEFGFGFDATSEHGASGSPIFNENGMLIGVLNAGVNKTDFNFGIKAKYVKDLLENRHQVK